MALKYDHLSETELWDLIYETAKNTKKRKKTWGALMSSNYVLVVRDLSRRHLLRLSEELKEETWRTDDDPKVRAYSFIVKIYNKTTRALESHAEAKRNTRRYAKVSSLVEYVEYLKDSLQDMRELVPADSIDFEFSSTLSEFENESVKQVDTWIKKRNSRYRPGK